MLIEREDVIEDTFNITELKSWNLAISIKEKDLYKLDIQLIEQRIKKYITLMNLDDYENQNKKIIRILELEC